MVNETATRLGLGVALVSLPSPLLIAGDLQTGSALAAMHVVAGMAWFFGVRRPSSAR